jgi:manganese transport system ATP-binding protein
VRGRRGPARGAGPVWAAADHAVRVRDVTYRYPAGSGRRAEGPPALDRAAFDVRTGEVTGLIGVNGAGKSTVFKTLMGILRPDAGSLEILGRTPDEARRTGLVGYVPQAEAVDDDFPVSVRDVVATGRYGRLGITRRLRQEDRDAVDAALEQVELGDLADRQVGRLSGGQRRRAFVARGLAQGAQVLLLDEPFAGVDARSERVITGVLRDLTARGGAVLVSTHDLAALPALADHVVLVHHRVLAAGPPGEVLTPENLALSFGGEVAR